MQRHGPAAAVAAVPGQEVTENVLTQGAVIAFLASHSAYDMWWPLAHMLTVSKPLLEAQSSVKTQG